MLTHKDEDAVRDVDAHGCADVGVKQVAAQKAYVVLG